MWLFPSLGQEPTVSKTQALTREVLSHQPVKTQEQLKILEPVVPKEPPPEPEFVADPPSISAYDL